MWDLAIGAIRGGVHGLNAQLDGRPIGGSTFVIVLGIILAVIGYFTGLAILESIGGLLVLIGLVLWILGAVGRPVGGRKVWF